MFAEHGMEKLQCIKEIYENATVFLLSINDFLLYRYLSPLDKDIIDEGVELRDK